METLITTSAAGPASRGFGAQVWLTTLAGVLLAAGAGCGADDAMTGTKANIVTTAESAGSFNTLVSAINAAELKATLEGPGPFTVFAPTDAAFDKVPAATLQALLQPENKAMLQAVLKYHVVSGKVKAADVVKLTKATTVQGADVAITVTGNKVKVNDANVTQTDVEATNGVIHVIDAVLLPPPS